MRKYWKFTAIIIVIVLSIGSFYVNSATSAEQYPKFVIQTLSGDAQEIKPMMLRGYYIDTSSTNSVNSNLTISAKGSTYHSPSFLDQLIGNPPIVIKGLQEKHRTFMRGKDPVVDWFSENNQFLAYADVDYGFVNSRNYKFDISVLNKESGTITSFMMKVPNGKELDYIFVEDIQIIKDKLYVITNNMIKNKGNQYEEKQIYTIDIATKKIINHEAIIQVPKSQEQTRIDVQLVRTSPTKASERLIILKTENKISEDMESTRDEVVSQEIISYNVVTKEKETINIPNLHLDRDHLSFFDGSTIYFMMWEGQNLVVTPYRFEDDSIGQPYTIQLSSEKGTMPDPMTIVKDGKLYVTSSQMTSDINSDVIVADAYTGKILFKGQVALDDSSKEKSRFDLSLHDLFVK